MEEIWCLLEEHEAIRRTIEALERAVARLAGGGVRDAGPSGVRACLTHLQELLEVHLPKDEELVIPLLVDKGVLSKEELTVMQTERAVMVQMLEAGLHCARAESACSPRALGVLAEGIGVAVLGVMLNEEAFVYPLLLSSCDEEEVWHLSVALDRAVDRDGRALRSALLAA